MGGRQQLRGHQLVIDERTGRIIMMGALDNLVKGAAGQAVQNMNLLFGLPESEAWSWFPASLKQTQDKDERITYINEQTVYDQTNDHRRL